MYHVLYHLFLKLSLGMEVYLRIAENVKPLSLASWPYGEGLTTYALEFLILKSNSWAYVKAVLETEIYKGRWRLSSSNLGKIIYLFYEDCKHIEINLNYI